MTGTDRTTLATAVANHMSRNALAANHTLGGARLMADRCPLTVRFTKRTHDSGSRGGINGAPGA